jgi:hypothetical protein
VLGERAKRAKPRSANARKASAAMRQIKLPPSPGPPGDRGRPPRGGRSEATWGARASAADRNRTRNPQLRRLVLYPVELRAAFPCTSRLGRLVGVRGFEPPTSCSQSRHSTGLSYTPTIDRHFTPGHLPRGLPRTRGLESLFSWNVRHASTNLANARHDSSLRRNHPHRRARRAP